MLRVGMVAPLTVSYDVVQGYSGFDLTDVSAATIEIRKPDGTTASWSTVLSNQTASTLTVTHSLTAAPSEIDQAGTWRMYIKFTVTGGYRMSEEFVEQVKREHGD